MCVSRVPTNPGDKIVRVFLFFGEFISYTILLVLVLVSSFPFPRSRTSSLGLFLSLSLFLSPRFSFKRLSIARSCSYTVAGYTLFRGMLNSGSRARVRDPESNLLFIRRS